MKDIITALNAAYKECGYVQKQGKNKEQGYKFAGEADFIEAIRPVLLAHGIVVFPSGYEIIKAEDYLTKSGSRMNRIVAKYTFTFAHTSGETISVVAIGEGADTSDKSSPKAATIALKYALRQTLLIETGDDPDVETPEERTPHQRDEAREKSIGKVEGIRAIFSARNPKDFESWFEANPKELGHIKWIKEHYPDTLKPLEDMGMVI